MYERFDYEIVWALKAFLGLRQLFATFHSINSQFSIKISKITFMKIGLIMKLDAYQW